VQTMLELLLATSSVTFYSCLMYWAHRLNTRHIRKRVWHQFSRGEAEHHKGTNTGGPFWIHAAVATIAATPFCLIGDSLMPLATAMTGAVFDRGWHHIDHVTVHHRASVNHNYGLGPGYVWDHLFRTFRL